MAVLWALGCWLRRSGWMAVLWALGCRLGVQVCAWLQCSHCRQEACAHACARQAGCAWSTVLAARCFPHRPLLAASRTQPPWERALLNTWWPPTTRAQPEGEAGCAEGAGGGGPGAWGAHGRPGAGCGPTACPQGVAWERACWRWQLLLAPPPPRPSPSGNTGRTPCWER